MVLWTGGLLTGNVLESKELKWMAGPIKETHVETGGLVLEGHPVIKERKRVGLLEPNW